MKYCLITGTTIDGTHEHRGHAILKVKNQKSLDNKIKSLFKKNKQGFDAPSAYFGYGDGETISEFNSVQEISQETAWKLIELKVAYIVT